MIKKVLILLLSAVVLLGAACKRIDEPSGGDVLLTFRIGEPVTKATTPGDGNVADGGGVYCTEAGGVVTPDLVIFIFDEDGTLKKRYPTDGVLTEHNYASGHATTLSVSFGSSGWEDGAYTVFALANIAGTGGNLDIPDLSSITSISQLETLKLGISSGTSPQVGDRMPLSASGTLHVAKGLYDKYNGLLELEMLRCFAKVQLTFRNLTGAALTLTNCSVKFKDMNTQKAWIFPREPDFVTLGGSGTKDDNYGDYTTVAANIASLSSIPFTDNLLTDDDERDRDVFVSPLLFFPSIAPSQTVPSAGNRYLCDISFKVGSATKTFNNLPIHDEYTQDILALERNQYLHIVTTISSGVNVSFNFYVKNWDEHHESVIFN
ncbi:MAG: FimB/Mfa2 family fimbrial subunit [Bacteroidales bacterium]|nr:FimB/Mfa2 family fimbrial subunit [Bacteroidales bacterium]